MDGDPELVEEREGGVLVLRLNRPEARNALTGEMVADVGARFQAADVDPSVSVVILTGTGDRAFCAGMDLRGFGARGSGPRDDEAAEGSADYMRFIRQGIGKPVIGAANGPAVAGGLELLLACDLVVAAEGATFGLPEVKRGLFAAGGGALISRRLPWAVAAELVLTGDRIDADRALALGLVNAVVPADRVRDEAFALAARIAANGPLAVAASKRLLRTAFDAGPDAAWELQAELQPQVFGSEDAKEGAAAFVERRDPEWKGR